MSEAEIDLITATQQAQVCMATERFIALASEHFLCCFKPVPVVFNLRGRSAGQFRAHGSLLGRHYQIRYNPWVFALDFPHHLADTVPHEVAHYITYLRHPRARPHGREWKSLMQLFGATPRACSPYRIEGIPVRQQQRHEYICNCKDRVHAITTTRQKRMLQGQGYICRDCRTLLRQPPATRE